MAVTQCIAMRFGLAVWLMGFVLLADWRKAKSSESPVKTGYLSVSAFRHSANEDLTSVIVICRLSTSCMLTVNDFGQRE